GVRMGRCIGLAHLAGILLAVVSSVLTDADSRGGLGFQFSDAMVLAVYAPLAMLGCGWWSMTRYERVTSWLRERRPPTSAEQRAVLLHPWYQGVWGLVPWLGAGTLWGLLNGVVYDNGLAY